VTTRARILGGGLAAAVAIAAPMGAYFEGVFPVGYADPVGIPTDCVGETEGARIGVQRFTFDECLARYAPRLARNWEALSSRCVFRDVTVPQAGALISWSDNVGITAACGSTLVRMLNAGAPPATWCAQLSRWNKATLLGVTIVLPGLTKRRRGELAMCLGDVDAWRHARACA
jgi:lysozyme